jgi:hypothetical protein
LKAAKQCLAAFFNKREMLDKFKKLLDIMRSLHDFVLRMHDKFCKLLDKLVIDLQTPHKLSPLSESVNINRTKKRYHGRILPGKGEFFRIEILSGH